MIKTFTSPCDLTAEKIEKERENPSIQAAEPSHAVLQNILKYSQNLEIIGSELVGTVELIKS